MLSNRLTTATLGTAIALALITSAGRIECRNDSGWFLSQKSGIAGDYDLYLNQQNILMIKKTSGIRIYARAPAWKVLILNDKTHLFVESSLQDFPLEPKTRLFQEYGRALQSGTWHKIGTEKYLTADVVKYQVRFAGQFAEDLSFARKHRLDNRAAEYSELIGFTLPPPELTLLRKLYVLPTAFSGLPMRLDMSGDAKNALLTKEIKPIRAVPQLKLSARCKRASSMVDVFQDPNGTALMNSLGNWFGPSETNMIHTNIHHFLYA